MAEYEDYLTVELLRDLCSKLQVDVFAYEYSGYGESSGVPSEQDLFADIDAAFGPQLLGCGSSKTGSNRAQNMAMNYQVFKYSFYRAMFRGSNYSQMVNFDFLTYCNIFLDIFGTSKKIGQMSTLRPLIYYRNPKTYTRQDMETFSKTLFL